jgi:hypothetical protein
VKSFSGTPKKVAVAPPDAFLQSLQWQVELELYGTAGALGCVFLGHGIFSQPCKRNAYRGGGSEMVIRLWLRV